MIKKRKTSASSESIREYQRNWLKDKLKNDPEYKAKHYANRQNRAKQNKEKLTLLKESNFCSACGEYHPACCMDHHHLDSKLKTKEVSRMLQSNSWEKIEKEISKCVLLCANCHRKLHEGLITLHIAGECHSSHISLIS